jgi:hypothetical protein
MDVCVCLSGADGRVVEGRATLFPHHREVSRVRIPWMLCVVVFVLCRPEKRRRERVSLGQKTAFRRHFSNMAARAAKIRGGKVEIRKEHIEIYKVTHFQNSRKTFQVKLPNDCTNNKKCKKSGHKRIKTRFYRFKDKLCYKKKSSIPLKCSVFRV